MLRQTRVHIPQRRVPARSRAAPPSRPAASGRGRAAARGWVGNSTFVICGHRSAPVPRGRKRAYPKTVPSMRFFRKKLSKIFGRRPSSRAPATPSDLLARAAFRRSVGDWPAAGRDLDEVAEIAEPGPMRPFLCDLALARAACARAPRRLRAAERPRPSRAPRRRRGRAAAGGSARATRRRVQTRRRLPLSQARPGSRHKRRFADCRCTSDRHRERSERDPAIPTSGASKACAASPAAPCHRADLLCSRRSPLARRRSTSFSEFQLEAIRVVGPIRSYPASRRRGWP